MWKKISQFAIFCGFVAAAGTATADGLSALIHDSDVKFELRYRFEGVDQAGKPREAAASTVRLRLNYTTGSVGGCAGFIEGDLLLALGHERYDDTRNGKSDFPVVADPEGIDLNQARIECRVPGSTVLYVGRQRIALDGERFVGPVGWRQNEQTFDALRVETRLLPGTVFNYAFVDSVRRVFGPDAGTPPASLNGASHLLNLRVDSLPIGALSLYGYLLDFEDAPQQSSDTLGARYDGVQELGTSWNLRWALEYARQTEAGANAAEIDAHFSIVELGVGWASGRIVLGREILSGKTGVFDAATNPAFQTPLATLHIWQGWADKFTTTPSSGIEDRYLGIHANRGKWRGQAVWHEFFADEGDSRYGDELDLVVARRIGDRHELLAKLADYRADALFTDTRKFWLQFSATF